MAYGFGADDPDSLPFLMRVPMAGWYRCGRTRLGDDLARSQSSDLMIQWGHVDIRSGVSGGRDRGVAVVHGSGGGELGGAVGVAACGEHLARVPGISIYAFHRYRAGGWR